MVPFRHRLLAVLASEIAISTTVYGMVLGLALGDGAVIVDADPRSRGLVLRRRRFNIDADGTVTASLVSLDLADRPA